MRQNLKLRNFGKIILPLLLLVFINNSCTKEKLEIVEEESTSLDIQAKSSYSVELSYSSITASAQQSSNPISNIDDSSMSTRWSGFGTSVNVDIDFNVGVTIDYVNIAFHKGDERTASFSYWYSNDGTSWTKKGGKTSSGNTEDHQEFDLSNMTARYLRLEFKGNSNSDWNSVLDLEIFGTPGITAPTCTATTPTGRTSNPTSNSVDLSWDAISNIDHYNVRYRVAGTSNWTNKNSLQTNSVTVTGLSSSTDYEWQMRAKCADGSASEYADAESTFTTEGDGGTTCTATTPTGRTSNPTSNSVDLSWDAISNIDHYNVRYRVAGTSSWTNKNSLQTNSVTVTGLSSSTDYEWQMRAKCADGSASEYADAESYFTTESDGNGGNGGDGTLDPNQAPSENFDLSKWKITLSSGDEKSVSELNNGYELSNQFYTGSDGGMVFKNYPLGAGTTTNSTYSRVELREMLRGTNTSISTQGINGNNWVFSTSSSSNQNSAGGVDGVMEATLKVDRVTTTSGSTSQIGRVIIGQIHASNDEPIRLYYHKQPGHSKGAIYFAHDPSSGDEVFENMIGNYVEETGGGAGDYTGAGSPSNGIALGEEFSYRIEVVGSTLYVTLYDASGSTISSTTFNMSSSGFANDYMYFKAGLYSGNKTVSSSSDYEQVTFYNLVVTH